MSFERGFEFDHFAQRPMYEACPRWLIQHCQVGPASTVVDLGCGSGIVTRMLLERFRNAPDFRVIAIDPSEWELQIARSRISDPRVTFVRGRAQEALEVIDRAVDAVFLCNVLHQIPLDQRQAVVDGAYSLVRPGGWFGANTLFYDGAVLPETRGFYVRFIAEAREALSRAGISWQTPTDVPVSLQLLSPEAHAALFRLAGFDSVHVDEPLFNWAVEDWQALSRYSVFVQGALWPGVDVAAGSRALIAALAATYDAMHLDSVPRRWLQCAGRRPLA